MQRMYSQLSKQMAHPPATLSEASRAPRQVLEARHTKLTASRHQATMQRISVAAEAIDNADVNERLLQRRSERLQQNKYPETSSSAYDTARSIIKQGDALMKSLDTPKNAALSNDLALYSDGHLSKEFLQHKADATKASLLRRRNARLMDERVYPEVPRASFERAHTIMNTNYKLPLIVDGNSGSAGSTQDEDGESFEYALNFHQ